MSKAKVYKLKNDSIGEEIYSMLGEEIRNGKTICFPTETVYGLGANALDNEAVKKIFLAKGRPQDNPLIVHVSNKDISKYVKTIPKIANQLIERFWPGPLTLILNKSDIIPETTSANLSTVGIRMPNNKIALKIIEWAGVPLAAPSANTSGKPSATNVERCIEDLGDKVDYIIGDESSEIGVESTILDVSVNPPVVLRPGFITIDQLKEFDKRIEIDDYNELVPEKIPKAPGMKYRHYAPKAKMKLILGEKEKVKDQIIKIINETDTNKKIGILCFDDSFNSFNIDVKFSLGNRNYIEDGLSFLYENLRKFDDLGVDIILSEGYNLDGLGIAIMNRMLKASSNEFMYV